MNNLKISAQITGFGALIMTGSLPLGAAIAFTGILHAMYVFWKESRQLDRNYKNKADAADNAQVAAFVRLGVPPEIAQQTLPGRRVRDILFSPHPMGDIAPVVRWLKKHRPDEFAKLNPDIQART